MDEIFEEIKLKISIDEETVSLNALELFSRSGLKAAINELINECV
jgi:hypothetical protein